MTTMAEQNNTNALGGNNTTMATWAGAIVRALDEAGCDPGPVLGAVGVDGASVDDPAQRIPVSLMTRLWHRAVDVSADPAFGLRVARQVNVTTFHGLVMAAMASNSLPQAVERLCQFATMVSDGLQIQCHFDEQLMTLIVGNKPGYPRFAAASVEATLGALVLIGRQMLAPGARPVKVMFRHRAFCSPSVYRDFFQCPVKFSARCDGLQVALQDLVGKELVTRSPALAQANAALCKQYLEQRSQGRVQAMVRERLVSRLQSGEPLQLPFVANDLAMSERKLQRLLSDEGWQFRVILDEVRAEHTLVLLGEGPVHLQQVAEGLGFDSMGAFTRACQRWHGCTPRALRRSLSDGTFVADRSGTDG